MTIACQTVTVYAVGSLRISSTPPGAEIFLALQPDTPVDQGVTTIDGGRVMSNLQVGTYNIRLTLAGYNDWTGQATVSEGVETPVSATLTPSVGNVTITSTPSGATMYIDDVLQTGVTPATKTGLTPGTHSYRLTLAGYADATGNFSITGGATTPLDVTFAGSAYITSSPEVNARVWLAISPGTPVDQGTGKDTPIIFTGMTDPIAASTRLWNYKLTRTGYTDSTGNFTATAGTTVNVPVTMLTVANITATSVTVTTSETPCMVGTCTITVVVRWSNSGQTNGTVIPNIRIDGVLQTPHASRTVPAGSFIDETFTVTGLSAAAHTICPDPN